MQDFSDRTRDPVAGGAAAKNGNRERSEHGAECVG